MEMLNGFKDSKLSMNLINKIKNEKSEKNFYYGGLWNTY